MWTSWLLLAAALNPAGAHDYWLEAEPSALEAPGPVDVHLYLGQDFVPEEDKPHAPDRTVTFVHVHGGAEHPASAHDGGVPAVDDLVLDEAGGHLLALERNAAWIALEPEKFASYLEHEGLTHVAEARAASGEQDQPGRERYTRYLKVWVPVGEEVDDIHAAVIGHRLELRLLERPVGGRTLTVEARVEGQPIADQPVTAIVRRADGEGKVASVTRTTDAEGRVSFVAAAEGDWLVRTVHMRRCEGCPKADWESFWAAYRFPVLPAPATALSEPAPSTPTNTPSAGWGCGCRVAPVGAAAWPVAALLGLALWRRRRRGRAT